MSKSELIGYIGFTSGGADLSNYYTKEQTDDKIAQAIVGGDVALDDYAKKAYVDEAIANIDIPEVDLTNYATKEEIPTKTSQLTNDSNFLTEHQSLEDYAKKSEIPSKTSQLTNDSSFASQEYVAQKIAEAELAESDVDLSAYYTKSETDAQIEKAQPDLSGYALKTEIPSTTGLATEDYVDDAVSNVKVDLTGYATEEYVGIKIAEAQLGEGEVDLSGYYTKTETDTAIKNAVDAIDIPETDLSNYYNKQEVDAKIPDTSGFLTAVPDEYVTETELAAKGYLTEHQSLEGYAKTIDIPSLEGYAKTTDIPDVSGFLTEVPAEYVTETELAGAGYQTEAQVLALITANLPASGEEVSY